MMGQPTVSVIVISRGRPADLKRCLIGIGQLYYRNFELILVADRLGLHAAYELKAVSKQALFEKSNIAVARNIGLRMAAGDIVAFIDDDAVPEPTWLDYLVEPFEDESVAAVGGFVRARNGISFQWKARTVDRYGRSRPLNVENDRASVFYATTGYAVRTEGTNMAVRREIIANLGGFDPNFRFFMDETDLNMRMARAGFSTAIAPLAQVHHGYVAGLYRRADRVPKSLFEIGASVAVYLRKYAPAETHEQTWKHMHIEQHRRLLSHMVSGGLEPRDVGILMQTLEAGRRDGQARVIAPLDRIQTSEKPFLMFSKRPVGAPVILSGRFWRKRNLRRKAAKAVREGHVVSVFLFTPTALFHRVSFRLPGFWEQRGGVFGRSERSGPAFRLMSFRTRLRHEMDRIEAVRVFPRSDGRGDAQK